MFNVATMMPFKLSAPVVRLGDPAASSFGGGLLSEQTMEELKKLDLVAGIDLQPAPAAPKPAADETQAADDAATARHAVGNIALFVAQSPSRPRIRHGLLCGEIIPVSNGCRGKSSGNGMLLVLQRGVSIE